MFRVQKLISNWAELELEPEPLEYSISCERHKDGVSDEFKCSGWFMCDPLSWIFWIFEKWENVDIDWSRVALRGLRRLTFEIQHLLCSSSRLLWWTIHWCNPWPKRTSPGQILLDGGRPSVLEFGSWRQRHSHWQDCQEGEPGTFLSECVGLSE